MKNTFGDSIALTLFGESHGEMIGAVLDGMAPGIPVDETYIAHRLSLRRPSSDGLSTERREADAFRIVSGVYRGKTTGTPICVLIPNADIRSDDYREGWVRPGHADYTAQCKYHGYQDARGGGHFSGRLTAPIVAAGAIAMSALRQNGIEIGTHISALCGINDRKFGNLAEDMDALDDLSFPVLDETSAEEMKEKIRAAAEDGDSVGGILETVVAGMPAGVGEPWFDSLESKLSHALFSIPALKGVEFGEGFGFADLFGSEANDEPQFEGTKVTHRSNHNGGINGGISNGMPILFRTVIKPTPSISLPQDSIDLASGQNTTVSIGGRHDPAIVHRARAVVDAVTALVIADALALRFGTDFFNTEI